MQNKEISANSNLIKLSPIYTEGFIKVGGRLNNSDLDLDSKHQIILPYSHHITNLIILDIHKNNHHVGRSQVLDIIREQFWIIKGITNVRKVLNDCLPRKKLKVQPKNQFIADLPKERLLVKEPAFTATGVDYFGPIIIKQHKRTRSTQGQAKRYGAVFTCLTTRAVHLELAGDMTTDSFILALRRFISRRGHRGHPKTMWSDNGLNFVGAKNELYNILAKLNEKKLMIFS